MENITLSIRNPAIKQEIMNFLQRFPSSDVEFTTLDDIEDLKLLQETRHEDTVSWESYLSNAD